MNTRAIGRFLEFCEGQREWILEMTEALAAFESPSTDKPAVDRCGLELALRLAAIGGRVTVLPREHAGDLVRAEWGAGLSQVLVLGHFDTVWPVGQVARMPIKREHGRLYGPGTFDMKAGIAIASLATRALYELEEAPASRIVMLWTTDEEIGSTAARGVIEEEAGQSDAVLVVEPALAGGGVKTQRKGCGEFDVRVRGIAAHAGVEPEKGASAIRELARQIVALEGLQVLQRGISINVGLVGGGTRANVVAEEAWATVDVRAATREDADRIDAAMRALSPTQAGTSVQVTGGFGRPPMERTPAVARLYESARAVAAELGRDLKEGATGGGSDGNFTAALGVPTLDGLGPIGDGAHALHEHVEMAELPWRAALLAGVISRVGGHAPHSEAPGGRRDRS